MKLNNYFYNKSLFTLLYCMIKNKFKFVIKYFTFFNTYFDENKNKYLHTLIFLLHTNPRPTYYF